MSGTTEKVTGRVKEAAGALTDDDKLRRAGKGDQLAGKAKDIADRAIDKARDVAGKVSDKVEDVKRDMKDGIDKARDDMSRRDLDSDEDLRARSTPRN